MSVQIVPTIQMYGDQSSALAINRFNSDAAQGIHDTALVAAESGRGPIMATQSTFQQQNGNYIYKNTTVQGVSSEVKTYREVGVHTKVNNNIFAWYNHYVECYNSINNTNLVKICCLPTFCSLRCCTCKICNLFIVPLRNTCFEVVRFIIYFILACLPYVNLPLLFISAVIIFWVLWAMIKVVINWVKCKCRPFKMMVYAPELCYESENNFFEVTVDNCIDVIGCHTQITKDSIIRAIAPYRAQLGSTTFTIMTYKLPFWSNYIRLIMVFFFWLAILVASIITVSSATLKMMGA